MPGGRAAVTEQWGWEWHLRIVLAEDLRPSRAVGLLEIPAGVTAIAAKHLAFLLEDT